MNRLRRSLAVILVAALPVAGSAACSDDDKDGEPEIEAPEVDVNPDNDSNTQP